MPLESRPKSPPISPPSAASQKRIAMTSTAMPHRRSSSRRGGGGLCRRYYYGVLSTAGAMVWIALIVSGLVVLHHKAWDRVNLLEERSRSSATAPTTLPDADDASSSSYSLTSSKHHFVLSQPQRSLSSSPSINNSSNSNQNNELRRKAVHKKTTHNSTSSVLAIKGATRETGTIPFTSSTPGTEEKPVLLETVTDPSFNVSETIDDNPKDASSSNILVSEESSSMPAPHYKLGLVRAIGNALPPRHDANQTLRNLEFILKHEPPFLETVHKHWIFNRILDKDLLQQLVDLLQQYNQTSYTIIPFVLKDYAKTQYEFKKSIEYEEYDMIHHPDFSSEEWSTMDRAGYWDKILTWKNLYITNQNNARNLAIDWYHHLEAAAAHPEQERRSNAAVVVVVKPSMVDYILPWDGNCFLTQAAHDLLQQDLIRSNSNPEGGSGNNSGNNSRGANSTASMIRSGNSTTPTPIKYFFTRMDRLKQENEVLLDPDYQPVLKEEPQVIMHRSAVGRFDPKLPYGKKNKVALLIRLRIPGSWDKLHNGPPPDTFADWKGPTRSAGWVSRLFSGSAHMEESNKSKMRGKARSDGMMLLVQRVDLQVAQELNHWNASTWMYFDRDVLNQRAAVWQQRQNANNATSSKTTTSNDGLDVLVNNLLDHANAALAAGPWSVMDKESCGCGPSGNCHVYYNVKGHAKAQNTSAETKAAECSNDPALRYDRSRLEAFQYNTTILALAYTITGESLYANRAAQNLVTWFVDPSTKMNPQELSVVWQRKTKETHNSKFGPIDFKDFYFFLDAVRMIEESGAMSQEERASLKAWFVQYLEWLAVTTDSSFRRTGKAVYFEPNRHGLYYDLQLVAVASYAGNLSLALQTMQESASRLLTHVHTSGKLRMEVGGEDCEHLQMFTLQGWSTLARMAKKVGLNLWSRFPSRMDKTSEAASALCRAAEHSIPLLQNRARCTKNATGDPDVSRWFPLYLEARQHCPNLSIANDQYLWPDWWPTIDASESPLPSSSPFKMNPLYSQETGIAPFWNLALRQEWFGDISESKSNSKQAAEEWRPQPLNLPTTERSLSTLPGHYKNFLNGTLDPPKVYLYDVLPAYNECLAKNQGALDRYRMAYKHGGEVWFLEQVASSPWRTFDKEAADLFVIPLLPGFVLYQQVCVDEAMETLRWIKGQQLPQRSTLHNHVLLTTHYAAEKPTIETWCPECIHLHQENSVDAPQRHGSKVLTVSAPMMSQLYRVSHPHQSTALSPLITEKLRNQDIDEFANTRPRAFYFAGQADDRKAYRGRQQVRRVWDALNKKNNSTVSADHEEDFTFIITKQNPKYTSNKDQISPSVTKRDYNFTHDVSTTRFGYQGRGDNPTSSRIFEWIDVGAIPVLVIDDAWLPGRHIPWKDFTISISENLTDEQLSQEFERIAYDMAMDELDTKRQVLRENAPAILWAARDSVVAEVMLVDAWEALQEKRGRKVNIDDRLGQVTVA